jgi:hypothetical protein
MLKLIRTTSQGLKREYSLFKVRWSVRRNFKEFFKIGGKLRRLGIMETQKIHWNQSEIHFYSANIIAQTLHKLDSITILISRGLSVDAWLVARSLTETALDYDYILRNPEKLDLYFKYSTYLDLQHLDRIRTIRPLSAAEQEEYDNLKEFWESHKHLFATNGRLRNSWRDKSLEEIGKEARLTYIYTHFYREANDYVHGNSNTIKRFIVGKTGEGLWLKAGGTFDRRDITLITTTTLALVLLVLKRANKSFKLGFNNEIRSLDAMVMKFAQNLKRNPNKSPKNT